LNGARLEVNPNLSSFSNSGTTKAGIPTIANLQRISQCQNHVILDIMMTRWRRENFQFPWPWKQNKVWN
jgi:hypothetical protein